MQEDLVRQAQRGDAEAFDSLARMVGDRCLAIAVRILRDLDLAEDAVQAALITAWRELRTLRDPSRFEPWLHRILTNACYAEARRRRRWSEGLRILPVAGANRPRRVPDRGRPRPARTGLPEAHRRAARRSRLPPLPRSIDLRGGGSTGLPVGTVKSRLHHATRALRASIEADARSTAEHPGATGMNARRDPDRLIHAFLDGGRRPSWRTRSTTRFVTGSKRHDSGSSSARGGCPP